MTWSRPLCNSDLFSGAGVGAGELDSLFAGPPLPESLARHLCYLTGATVAFVDAMRAARETGLRDRSASVAVVRCFPDVQRLDMGFAHFSDPVWPFNCVKLGMHHRSAGDSGHDVPMISTSRSEAGTSPLMIGSDRFSSWSDAVATRR